jgi:hypothetical protein
MALLTDSPRLTRPTRHLVRMVVFLLLAAFVALILYEQIGTAFMANPGLNGLIFGVLFIGILLAMRQVLRLFREVRWMNAQAAGEARLQEERPPVLLLPVATMLGDGAGRQTISTATMRSVLDSVGMRLDEARDVSRYLTGLLIFLGLLGTFWGLLETVSSVGGVIGALQTGRDAQVLFDDLKAGLAEPLRGMAISFSSSLFGLAGSLVLGFLDLQAGQAQNRFYTELEDWLSTTVSDGASTGSDIAAAVERFAQQAQAGAVSNQALANLAEGIQGLVQHMRQEQQLIRDWVEAQADQQQELQRVLERLSRETERR